MTGRAWAFLIVAGLLLLTTIGLMWAGSEAIGRLGGSPGDNATWLVSQAEIELHRLRAAVSDHAAGRAPVETVALRVDLLASRVGLLSPPAAGAVLGEGERSLVVATLKELVEGADGLRAASAAPDAWAALLPRIDAARGEVHRLALRAVETVAAEGAVQARALRRIDQASKLSATIVALVMLGGLVWLLRQHRTMSRLTRDLRAAADVADKASRAKSAFLASMSHELRTPLNAIIGFADVMRAEIWGGLGDRRYHEYCDHIAQSGAHLLSLVNDVLDLSKVEAGRFELTPEPIDVGEQIAEALTMVRPQADARAVTLRHVLVDDLPVLRADQRRFRQILVNLLGNAVKFSPPGGVVRLEVGVRDGRVAVTVADQGPGMAPEQVAVALTPFGQIRPSAEVSHEGTGLGLPLSRALVEAHGGSFALDSIVGFGTTVRLSFPVADRPPAVRDASALAVATP